MSSSINVSQSAYTTILLHCAKYPASAVTGILLGTSSKNEISVIQAIPLQHHWNQLSPMVEAGLGLIQAHTSSQIIGVYYAPSDVSHSNKVELNPTAFKIAQTISTRTNSDAIALQIQNAKLADSTNNDHALAAFSVSANVAQAKTSAVKVADGNVNVTALAKAEIAKGKWQDIVDFDDHLEDTSRDWLHPITA